MKWLIVHLLLIPLCLRNMKARHAGKLPDRWYWGEKLIVRWGYTGDLLHNKSGNLRYTTEDGVR